MDMEQLLTKKAEELLKTEVVYCRNVRLLIEHYYKPLRALSYTKDKLLDPQETDTVFSNIEVIEKVATEMLQRLTERIEEEQSHRVGDIFCNLGFSLQLYSQFVSNFGTSSACLHAAASRGPFADWANKAKVRVKEATGNETGFGGSIHDLLIKPVQRVPRYELMLREMQKVLAKNGVPDPELGKAIELVHQAAVSNNEAIKDNESRQMLYEIQAKLRGTTIVTAGRRAIRAGDVHKISRKGHKPYKLVLLNDALLTVTVLPNGNYKLHHDIDLGDPAVGFSLRTVEHTGQIALCVVNKVKSFLCHCETEEAVEGWLDLLNATQEAVVSDRSLDRSDRSKSVYTSGIKRPVWTPDVAKENCNLCRALFSFTSRRHHCRVCGELVCGTCSPHRANLSAAVSTLERVCNACEQIKLKSGSYHVAADIVYRRQTTRGSGSLAAIQDQFKTRMSGFLEKKGGHGKNGDRQRVGVFGRRNWKKRWFVLRSTMLQYHASEEEEPLGTLILAEQELTIDVSKQRITLSTADRDFNIRMADATDHSSFLKWCSELRDAIDDIDRAQADRLRMGAQTGSGRLRSADSAGRGGLSTVGSVGSAVEEGRAVAGAAAAASGHELEPLVFDRPGPLGIEIVEIEDATTGHRLLLIKDPHHRTGLQLGEGATLVMVQSRSIVDWTFEMLQDSGLLKERPLTLRLARSPDTSGSAEHNALLPAAEAEQQQPAAEDDCSSWPRLWSRSLSLEVLDAVEDEVVGGEVPAVLVLLRAALVDLGGMTAREVFKRRPDRPTVEAAVQALEQTGALPPAADLYLCAALILQFYREFPGGILHGLSSEVVSGCESADDAVAALGTLSDTNQQIVVYLVDMITQVAKYEQENEMGAAQLAVEVALHICGETPLSGEEEECMQLFVYLLVEFWDKNT